MKILVMGTGRIGSAAIRDLLDRPAVTQVGVVDISAAALERVHHDFPGDKITTHCVDVKDSSQIVPVMKAFDAGIIMLPKRGASYKAIEAAIDARLNVVDILEEYHRRPDSFEIEDLAIPGDMTLEEYGESLHERAGEAGVTILDGMGFAPGLSNVTVEAGIRKLDVAESVVARVGGIPSQSTASQYPLKYMITWSFDHVIREYMVKVPVLQDGRIVEIEAASDPDLFHFNEFGMSVELESATTPGMPSFIHTRRFLRNFSERTIRWPGHWAGIQTLKDCGLLDTAPVEFDVCSIKPRALVVEILRKRLMAKTTDGRDSCVMWNTVKGKRNGVDHRIDYYMWDNADEVHNLSSMSRVTAFTATAAAVLLTEGLVSGPGIVAPEDGIVGATYSALLAQLKERNIVILERESAT